jgi:proline iminopeptidase
MHRLPKFSLAYILAVILLGWPCIISANQPLRHEQGYVDVADGKLHYDTYGDKGGVPMIVLHGGPGLDSGYLLPQMLQLASLNQATFYDQRGSGKSLGFALDPQTINMDNFVNDLEALRVKLNYEKFILVGHSWGSILAMRYATLYPEHVSDLILISSGPATSDGFKAFIAEYNQRLMPIGSKVKQIENSAKFRQYDPNTVADYYRLLFSIYFYKPEQVAQLSLQFTPQSAQSGIKVGEIMGQSYLANYDLRADLQQLKMPVLVVHGKNDLIPIAYAQEIAAAIPNSKLIAIQECDHFPYIEQPMELFGSIRKFLGQTAQPRATIRYAPAPADE